MLASILGLDRYENIRRLAAERIKQTTAYKLHMSTLSAELEQELTHEPVIEQKLKELRHKHVEITTHEQVIARSQQILDRAWPITKNKTALSLLLYKRKALLLSKTHSMISCAKIKTQPMAIVFINSNSQKLIIHSWNNKKMKQMLSKSSTAPARTTNT